MSEKQVGIRALKQNASEVIQMVKQGDVVVITERGVPVAQINPIKKNKLQELIEAGLATPAKKPMKNLLKIKPIPGLPTVEEMLAFEREDSY